ncbi:MAG: hypothetical protein HQM10_18815 [Candidatus Riflebacteria bacterium]|nr:hypothetical protein [Candidatus Riflebacteria bacterium]
MKKMCASIACALSLLAISTNLAVADPFDDKATVSNPKTIGNTGATNAVSVEVSPRSLETLILGDGVFEHNLPGSYSTKILENSFTCLFHGYLPLCVKKKGTKRLAWLEYILADHGMKIDDIRDDRFSVDPKFVYYDYYVTGRNGILSPLSVHYRGGSVTQGSFSLPSGSKTEQHPELAAIVNSEKNLTFVESHILDLQMEYDKHLDFLENARWYDPEGLINLFIARKKVHKRMNEILLLLASSGTKIAKAQAEVDKNLIWAAEFAENGKNYEKALLYYNMLRNPDNSAKAHIAECYVATKDYTAAIKAFRTIQPPDDKATLRIAETLMLQGNEKEAIQELFITLRSYNGSTSELKAIKLLDEWNLPEKAKNSVEIKARLAAVFFEKSLFEGLQGATPDAIASFKRSCEMYDSNNPKNGVKYFTEEHKSKVVMADSYNKEAIANVVDVFTMDKKAAIANVNAKEKALFSATSKAQEEYLSDLKALDEQLKKAQSELASLKNAPSTTPSTSNVSAIEKKTKDVEKLQKEYSVLSENKVEYIYQRITQESAALASAKKHLQDNFTDAKKQALIDTDLKVISTKTELEDAKRKSSVIENIASAAYP